MGCKNSAQVLLQPSPTRPGRSTSSVSCRLRPPCRCGSRGKHLPVIFGSGLKSEQVRSPGFCPKMARFKSRSITPGQQEQVPVSWCLLAARGLTGSHFWTGSPGVGQERKRHCPVCWQGPGEEEQGGQRHPFHLCSQEGTRAPGDGDGGGKQDGQGAGSECRCLKLAGVSTHQTLVLSPLPVPAPPTAHQLRPGCNGIYNPHVIQLIGGLNGKPS